jgi:hypothetical protein
LALGGRALAALPADTPEVPAACVPVAVAAGMAAVAGTAGVDGAPRGGAAVSDLILGYVPGDLGYFA